MKKIVLVTVLVLLAAVPAGGSAAGLNGGAGAAPMAPIVPGSGWATFDWDLAALPGDATSTFEFTGPARVTLVDAYCTGDRFRVYDNGVLILTTSPAQPPVCGFPEAVGDPDSALLLPQFYSQGIVLVGEGAHSLRVEVIESYFSGTSFSGGAFLRVDAVAAPAIPSAGNVGLAVLMVAFAVGGAFLVRQRLVG